MSFRATARTLAADALDLVARWVRPSTETDPSELAPGEERVSEQVVPVTLSPKAKQMIERSEPVERETEQDKPPVGSLAWRKMQERDRQ